MYHHRPAAAVVSDWIDEKLNPSFDWLATLWTGKRGMHHDRPPLLVRRGLLLTAPISYALIGLAYLVLFWIGIIMLIFGAIGLGLYNFFRKRWED